MVAQLQKVPQFLFLGKNVEIVGESIFVHSLKMKISNYVHIEPRGYYEAKDGLEVGDHVIIAPEIVILTYASVQRCYYGAL